MGGQVAHAYRRPCAGPWPFRRDCGFTGLVKGTIPARNAGPRTVVAAAWPALQLSSLLGTEFNAGRHEAGRRHLNRKLATLLQASRAGHQDVRRALAQYRPQLVTADASFAQGSATFGTPNPVTKS